MTDSLSFLDVTGISLRRADGSQIEPGVLKPVSWRPDPAKKVAIVGFASSSRDLAPFADQGVEIWTLNHLYSHVPRLTRHFEVHSKQELTKDMVRDGFGMQWSKDHMAWLRAQPSREQCEKEGKPFIPIYMQEAFPDIPASVPYPLADVARFFSEHFGQDPDPYLTSTPGEMIALAITMGFGWIGVYGIDMLQDEEYFYQRAGCEYYIGIARGAGITCHVPRECALLKASFVYGWQLPQTVEEQGPLLRLARFLKRKADEQTPHQDQAVQAFHTFDGAIQGMKEALRIADEQHRATVTALEKKATDLATQRENALCQIRITDGQKAMATSSEAWVKHVARGGTLEGESVSATS